jgi:hypothetical protein
VKCQARRDEIHGVHGRVIYTQPGGMLRLDTPPGPLQEMAVTGVLTFRLTPQDGGTLITMSYRVSGTFPRTAETRCGRRGEMRIHQAGWQSRAFSPNRASG